MYDIWNPFQGFVPFFPFFLIFGNKPWLTLLTLLQSDAVYGVMRLGPQSSISKKQQTFLRNVSLGPQPHNQVEDLL